MSRKWMRLVSWLCMVAFFAANTHANITLAALFHVKQPSQQPRARADEASTTFGIPSTSCKYCAKKAVADPTAASPQERSPCCPNCPDCPKGPCGPHCPCPGGCALCNIAKAPSAPALPFFALQPQCVGILPGAADNIHVVSVHCRLFRPPKV